MTAQVLSIVPNKKELGKLFKKDAKLLSESLEVRPYWLAPILAREGYPESEGQGDRTSVEALERHGGSTRSGERRQILVL